VTVRGSAGSGTTAAGTGAHRSRVHGGTGRRHAVRHEARLRSGALRRHGALRQAGHRGQNVLHLAELHAETADLELAVAPPREHQPPVGKPPCQIAGAVHARAGLGRERIGKERAGGQVRTPGIPPREHRTAQVHLAHGPEGDGAKAVVQEVRRRVGKRPADGDEAALHVPGPEVLARRDDDRLGGPVDVGDREPGARSAQDPGHVRGARRVAPGGEVSERGRRGSSGAGEIVGELVEESDGAERRADPVPLAAAEEVPGRVAAGIGMQDHRRAGGQRGQDLVQRAVPREGEERQRAHAGAQPLRLRGGEGARRHRRVLDDGALRFPGGAGREDDVGGLPREDRGPRDALLGSGGAISGRCRTGIPQRDHRRRGLRENALQTGRREHETDAGVPQHGGGARRRLRRVQRDVDAARLPDAEHPAAGRRSSPRARPAPRR
jgi:hypothetical protein